MTLGELRALFRRQTGDEKADYLWSNAEVTEFANEAEREACRRADLLIDSKTTKLCTVTVKAGKDGFDLDDVVLDIRRMRVNGLALSLDPISVADLDCGYGAWETQTGNQLLHYVPDMTTAFIRVYPIPTQDTVLRMTVNRLPLQPMVRDTDEPEILWRHHRKLIHWMMHLAYLKQDSETFDPAKAQREEAAFVKEFGPAKSARNEQWQRMTTFGLPDALL